MKSGVFPSLSKAIKLAVLLIGLGVLYLSSLYNYLLFHSLAEFASIAVAVCIFMIAWNARRYLKSGFLSFLGIAYLFIGFIDLMHTLSYKGMAIFADYDYYANQLWIGGRFMESISLVVAFKFLGRERLPRYYLMLLIYTALTAVLLSSVFWWKIFPVCFVDGVGLTSFKKISEYVISAILAISAVMLYRHRAAFERGIYARVFISVLLTIGSELAFTFYIDNYGLSNLVGHFFKLLSFYLLYEAIIETGIEQPYRLIFRELDEANHHLSAEIDSRKRSERQREELIAELQHALAEIRTLKGIVPICSHCKRIRDDAGYWNQIEQYVHDHSEAEFSHGICPECMAKYYESDGDATG